MSYWHYDYTRKREHDPSHHHSSLVHQKYKEDLEGPYDDNEYNDYPSLPPRSHKPSKALIIRPSTTKLQKYNIYNDNRDEEEDDKYRRQRWSREYYRQYYTDDEDDIPDDYEFKVKTRSSRPRAYTSSSSMIVWPKEAFRHKERWEDFAWQSRERERGDSFWDREPILKEKTVRYKKTTRTTMDEWKPLRGFRPL